MHPPIDIELLRLSQFSSRFGISEYLIKRGVETGNIPPPIIIGARTRVWNAYVLDALFAQCDTDELRARIANARLRKRTAKKIIKH